MRALVAGLVATALGAGAAFAASDVMQGYYGNTVTGTGDGVATRVHYRADHTFEGTTTIKGQTTAFQGTWSLDGKGNLCRAYPGQSGVAPNCSPILARKIGATWTITNGPYLLHMTLIAGIQ